MPCAFPNTCLAVEISLGDLPSWQ
jgi:hypothetical protein